KTRRAVALPVDEDVVLAARPRSVDRAGSTFGPRRAALVVTEELGAHFAVTGGEEQRQDGPAGCSLISGVEPVGSSAGIEHTAAEDEE
ncbi:hypothetical protein ACFXKE_34580, partial [Streptomyces sp. NPDC059202]|uniref:hypothetical protein n=1 Tax=Streptomyces sp. NPDC059202 TaxID=3346768 RepID=UPI0036843F52